MLRKHIIVISLAAVAALLAPAASAEVRIGFVSTERVLREAVPAVKAQKKLEKEFQPRQQELEKLDKQIKDLQASVEKEGMTLPETDRRRKERELAELNRDFQRKQREFREDRTLRANEELAGVIERANKAIRAIAEAEKYDIILQDAVWANPRIDITEKVIKALAAEK